MAVTVEKNTLYPGLKKYFKAVGISKNVVAGGAHRNAMRKMGIALLGFILNGSSNDPTVPPKKSGMLRGSGSVFVEKELVHTSRGEYPAGTPAQQYNAGKDTVAVGLNTAYAHRLHETKWKPGPGSIQSGNVGNKFIERHLIADRETLLKTYAAEVKRETGA
jgi:hypothetical protein